MTVCAASVLPVFHPRPATARDRVADAESVWGVYLRDEDFWNASHKAQGLLDILFLRSAPSPIVSSGVAARLSIFNLSKF
jgi:hypothetical protein